MGKYWEPEGFYQLGEGEYASASMRAVLERLKEATGVSTISGLAKWLGVREAWISDAMRRNILPVAWMQTFAAKKTEYGPEWLLAGGATPL